MTAKEAIEIIKNTKFKENPELWSKQTENDRIGTLALFELIRLVQDGTIERALNSLNVLDKMLTDIDNSPNSPCDWFNVRMWILGYIKQMQQEEGLTDGNQET